MKRSKQTEQLPPDDGSSQAVETRRRGRLGETRVLGEKRGNDHAVGWKGPVTWGTDRVGSLAGVGWNRVWLVGLLAVVVLMAFEHTPGVWSQERSDSTILVAGGQDVGHSATGEATDGRASSAPSISQGVGADGSNLEERLASPGNAWSGAQWHSLLTLLVGVAIVLVSIIGLKLNAFLGLIVAALVVSLMSGGAWSEKISRVGLEFGASAGKLGLVIALAAVIGQSFMASGCAERVVNTFVKLLGEKRTPFALCGSGYLLGIPVFFDTVFYLLVPLARSAFLRTKTRYLACLLAVVAGGTITHTLVPPTPGPLLVAANLGVNIGTMILVGSLIGVFAASAGMVFAFAADRWIKVPIRWLDDPNTDGEAKHIHQLESLPPLPLAVLPLALPVLLIAGATILTTLADQQSAALFQAGRPAEWERLRDAVAEPSADTTWSAWAGDGPESLTGDATGLVSAEDVRRLAASRVLRHLSDRLAIENRPPSTSDSAAETASVESEAVGWVNALNAVLNQRDFYNQEIFLGVPLGDSTQKLLKESRAKLPPSQVQRLNRLLLEDSLRGLVETHVWETPLRQAATWASMFGDANLALLIAAFVAILIEKRQRMVSWAILGGEIEKALASAGVIILITAAGGAFGAMLNVANIGDTIRQTFGSYSQSGLGLLVLGFGVSSLLKFAQGSSTVAMITASGMLASVASPEILGCHPVYLATAIGGGSLFGSWMNDSGFWIFAKMGQLSTEESLKTWTPCLAIVGFTGGVMTLVFAWLMPLI